MINVASAVVLRRTTHNVLVFHANGDVTDYFDAMPQHFDLPSEFTVFMQDAKNDARQWAFRRSSIHGVQFKGAIAEVKVARWQPRLVTHPNIQSLF